MAQSKRTLAPTTRMAIQAAVAVTIAILIGHFLQFERSYWAILTAMVLISQTFGESIKKSLIRLIMTILGGLSGTLIFFLIKDSPYLLLGCLLACLFLVVFFLEISYLWVVFFLTHLVVFLFALLQNWTLELLMARIEETFIGAFIAIVTSALVLPTRARTQLADSVPQFLKLASELADASLAQFYTPSKAQRLLNKKRLELLKAFATVDSHAKTMNYEVFFGTSSQAKFKTLLLEFNVLMHYIVCLVETLPYLTHNKTLAMVKPEILQTQQVIQHNFSLLLSYAQAQTPGKDFIDLDANKQAIFAKVNASIQAKPDTKECWLAFYPFYYFLRRINDIIMSLITQLK